MDFTVLPDLSQLEAFLLCCSDVNELEKLEEKEKLPLNAFKQICRGEFIEFLSSEASKKILQSSLEEISDSSLDVSTSECHDQLLVAISCLQLFVQHNWTGPLVLEKDSISNILQIPQCDIAAIENKHKEYLSVDGENIYEGIQYPSLLAISCHILSKSSAETNYAWSVWRLRSIFAHQSFLEEKCQSLKQDCLKSIRSLVPSVVNSVELTVIDGDSYAPTKNTNNDILNDTPQEQTTSNTSNTSTTSNTNSATEADCLPSDAVASQRQHCTTSSSICWLVEAALMALYYYEHRLCEALLKHAQTAMGLCISQTGIPGKRTRYQQKDIAQLIMSVQRKSSANHVNHITKPPSRLPENKPLNDDTVLDQIQLSKNDDASPLNDAVDLDCYEQAVILALCELNKYIKSGNAELIEEETLAHIRLVLDFPIDWSNQTKALYERSITEKWSGRRMERSLNQLELLSSLLSDSGSPSFSDRGRCVYAAALPPMWQIQRSLGEFQMSLGAFASAMEVFERLSLWDPLITCCQRAGRTGRAEEVIRERLAIAETPALYCSLSDVTGDPQYYEKAWELSGHRSARATRGLAFHHMRACNFEKALEFFEKTLSTNTLQLACWFTCGCAALATKNFDKAASSFRRYLMIDCDNFEAWNNLAAAYTRNGDKKRAFAVLQDALKCSYDNWRVWENYVIIGVDCAQFSEVIRGAHRLLDLQQKWADAEILGILTRVVVENIADCNGQPGSRLKGMLLELFGHVTSVVTNSGKVWQLYGQLVLSDIENCAPESIDRGVQYLQKGYRCIVMTTGWEKDIDKCHDTSKYLIELLDRRLQLKGHLAKLVQAHTDPVTKELNNEIKSLVQDLEARLARLDSALPAVSN